MAIKSKVIECNDCGYAGRVLEAHPGYQWWMFPVALLIACTGIGLLPVAVFFIFMGNRIDRVCPKCRGRKLSPYAGQHSPENVKIWKRAKKADDEAFKRNKWILFAVVMVMLAGSLVFYYQMTR